MMMAVVMMLMALAAMFPLFFYNKYFNFLNNNPQLIVHNMVRNEPFTYNSVLITGCTRDDLIPKP